MGSNNTFNAALKPKGEQQRDEEKRLIDKSIVESLVSRLKEKSATITKYERKKQSSKTSLVFPLTKI